MSNFFEDLFSQPQDPPKEFCGMQHWPQSFGTFLYSWVKQNLTSFIKKLASELPQDLQKD